MLYASSPVVFNAPDAKFYATFIVSLNNPPAPPNAPFAVSDIPLSNLVVASVASPIA